MGTVLNWHGVLLISCHYRYRLFIMNLSYGVLFHHYGLSVHTSHGERLVLP